MRLVWWCVWTLNRWRRRWSSEVDTLTQRVFGQYWHRGCTQCESLGSFSLTDWLCQEADLLRKWLGRCSIYTCKRTHTGVSRIQRFIWKSRLKTMLSNLLNADLHMSCIKVYGHSRHGKIKIARVFDGPSDVVPTFQKICLNGVPHEFPVYTRGFVHTEQTL